MGFKDLELGRWDRVIVCGLRCWCGILKMFGLKSESMLVELLVGFQPFHIERYILFCCCALHRNLGIGAIDACVHCLIGASLLRMR